MTTEMGERVREQTKKEVQDDDLGPIVSSRGQSARGALCTRQSARGALSDKINRQEARLNALVVLDKTIPWGILCSDDEKALWWYFTRSDSR